MMKNTLIVTAEDLITNYRSIMMEHLYVDQDAIGLNEFACDLETFSHTLRGLSNNNTVTALNTFKREFKSGSTLMLLADKDFNCLEKWNELKEDFQIAIFKDDGTPVGVVHMENISW